MHSHKLLLYEAQWLVASTWFNYLACDHDESQKLRPEQLSLHKQAELGSRSQQADVKWVVAGDEAANGKYSG